MTDPHHSVCPVAWRGMETFVEIVSVGGQRQRVEFAREIFWLQESSMTLRFLHGGQVIKEGPTFCDYRYLDSTRSIVPERNRLVRHFGVTRESTLELVMFASILHRPMIEARESVLNTRAGRSNVAPKWDNVPNTWRKEVEENGLTLWPMLGDVVLEESVVWSSRNSSHENDDAMSKFMERWVFVEAKAA